MITELSPLLSKVSTEVNPKDLLLSKGAWVFFSGKWTSNWKWCAGKLFEVSEEPVLVKFPSSYILPGADYKNIDLSNATAGLKLYPQEEGVIYQCGLGFKPGDYIVNIYVPTTSKYVYHLGESTQIPDVTNATTRYLGAKKPEDSPYDSPLLYLYFVKDGPAFYLQPYVLESVTFEKVSFLFHINKCRLTEVPNPSPEMINRARRISYYTELTGF